MSDQFIFDETKYIEYSAYCIGEYIKWGDYDWLRQTMIHRQPLRGSQKSKVKSQATVNQMFLEDIDYQDSIGTTRTADTRCQLSCILLELRQAYIVLHRYSYMELFDLITSTGKFEA